MSASSPPSGPRYHPAVDAVDDHELVRRWQAGDTAAGDQVFASHFWPIYRFFRSKLESRADDLAQRTFLVCLEARERLRPELGVRAFLFGIARRVLLESLWGLEREAQFAPEITSIAAATRSHASVLDAKDASRALTEALRELPLDFQIAVELHYWEGLTIVEISEVLGVPSGTVKSRLSRARRDLRAWLGDRLPDELADKEG
jgi:RNA polymerase sigma-70 factor, ECF subfamily